MIQEWYVGEAPQLPTWFRVLHSDVEEGNYIVLERSGEVSVYDGSEYNGPLADAPRNLKIQDGSFRRFVEDLASELGFQVELEPGDLGHFCIRLV